MGTTKKRRKGESRTKTASHASSPAATASDRRIYAALAVLVAALAALVWWSLPGHHAPEPEGEGATNGAAETAEPEAGARQTTIERPPRASAELAVITEKPEDVVRAAATLSAIGRHLDVRHCGGACDAVRKLMADEDAFEIDVLKTEDLLLPPKDTLDTVAPGLTPAERDDVRERPLSVVVRTLGNVGPEQLAARAAFAAAAVLAEQLDGFVYDEMARRIETKAELLAHTVTAKLGEPAFVPKHVVIQLYRQDDGTARLLTLGMARFGSPDISIRGASMSAGPLLAQVINAAASQIAHGKNEAPITITLDDVARVVGKKPSELSPDPKSAQPVSFDVVLPERIEGDPDNEMIELVPRLPRADTQRLEAWDDVVLQIFGASPSIDAPVDDQELAAIAKKAQRDLPAAIKRFEAGEGSLFVKGPFPIPAESRLDGGATRETLWIEAASCDATMCTGVLSNEPSLATNIALGKTTSVKLRDAVDWMLELRDGGAAGGESIKVLRARLADKEKK